MRDTNNSSSFKTLLIKKANDNYRLVNYIESIGSDFLADKVLESLKKMARSAKHMGSNANSAITSFAHQLTNRDVEMMRDALGHHISAHKAELKAGNRSAADQHLNKIVPLMHLVARAAPHSSGKLDIDYTPLEPWETNYTTLERRPETGKLKEGTKGLRRRPNKTDRSLNPRGVPDYRYLEMKPHGGHSDMKTSPHSESGYPFENIQVGGSSSIDSNQAYLPITEMQPTGVFKPHPFDDHPIHKLADLDQNSLSTEMQNNFASSLNSWVDHESSKKWNSSMRDLHSSDPESFKKRGKQKPSHHFDGVNLLDQPQSTENINLMSNLPPELAAKFASKTQQQQKQPQEQSVKLDASAMSNLPPELAAKFASKAQQAPKTVDVPDEDIEKMFIEASPEKKRELWPKYKAIMERKHGA